jgi:hypothetical protein
VVTIGVLDLLLNVSGLQLVRREDIDLNQELRAATGQVTARIETNGGTAVWLETMRGGLWAS